jgi:hypothetical protein
MSSVFISYRRQDAATEAGRIYARLVKSFGRDAVFKDVDSTTPGANFVHVIGQTIAMCDVLLVVIGPRWLQKQDGASRLHKPWDWVRIEILSALERNILVIPILVDGATMPAEADLPEALRPLASYQAVPLTETGRRSELTRLVRSISAHQRALDAPGSGDVQAGSRYYPFVGRRDLQPGSSPASAIVMEDRTGRGAKDLGDTSEISAADDLVAQFGRAARRRRLWPAALLTTAVAAAAASSGTSPMAAELILALGLPTTVWLAVRDVVRRTVVMRYECEDANVHWQDSPVGGGRRGLRASMRRALHARLWRSGDSSQRVAAWEAQSFQELIDAWRQLVGCTGLWRVERSGAPGSKRGNARSGIEICDLTDATRGLEGPTAIITNIEVPGVIAGDHALYFLPDRLLVRQGARFAELSYATVQADWQPMRFAEEQMPRDGERVGTTWERVKRNGDRDQRFNPNPEWPVLRYGRLEFSSETGLQWILLTSQAQAAERVIEAVRSREKPGSIVSVRAAGG